MISKRVIPCVLLLCVGLAAATLLAEMFLRVSGVWIARHSDHMFAIMQYDEILGWKMKPNIQTTIDMFDVENISVRANGVGLWDKEFSTEKSAGKLRIALLGDSFTWGYGVYENQRFGNILEDSHTRYECMNFGIPAYGTDQALLMWKHVASAYRPDLVILTIYDNDYMDNLSSVRWGRPKPYFELNTSGTLELRNVPVPKTNFWDNGILHEIAPPSAALFSAPVTRRSRIADWLVKHSDVVRAISALVQLNGNGFAI